MMMLLGDRVLISSTLLFFSFTSLLSLVLLLCCGYLLFLFPLSGPLKAPRRPSASSLLLSFLLFHFVNDQLARLQQTQGTVVMDVGGWEGPLEDIDSEFLSVFLPTLSSAPNVSRSTG